MRAVAARPPLAAALVLPSLVACQDDPTAAGEAATWEVNADRLPSADQRRISALVTRVECANGRTGRVLAPVVDEQEQRVVVTFRVARNADGDATCPGNRPVERAFQLERPLGGRTLLDGACLSPRPEGVRGCEPRQVWPTG